MEIKVKEGDEFTITLDAVRVSLSVDYCATEPDRFTINCDQPDIQGRCGAIYDLALDDTSAAESELIAAIGASQDEDEVDDLGGVVVQLRIKTSVPDPSCHRTGWSARFIEGRWCVGMTGNLDTIHDAVLVVNDHYNDDAKARAIAEFVAQQYNNALDM